MLWVSNLLSFEKPKKGGLYTVRLSYVHLHRAKYLKIGGQCSLFSNLITAIPGHFNRIIAPYFAL